MVTLQRAQARAIHARTARLEAILERAQARAIHARTARAIHARTARLEASSASPTLPSRVTISAGDLLAIAGSS